MKKILITVFTLLGIFSFSQKTHKRTVRKTYKKKVVQKSPSAKSEPSATIPIEIPKVEEVELPVAEIATDTVTPAEPTPVEAARADYEIVADKIQKKNGWINNRNSVLVRGIEGFVKGVYTGKNKIYILIEIDNHTNIPYDIESTSFITTTVQTGRRTIEEEEKVFIPIYNQQPQMIPKKTKVKIVYVFDKFTIADNKTLLFMMNEVDGERTVMLNIQPRYISKAELVN